MAEHPSWLFTMEGRLVAQGGKILEQQLLTVDLKTLGKNECNSKEVFAFPFYRRLKYVYLVCIRLEYNIVFCVSSFFFCFFF